MDRIDAHHHFWDPARGDYGWMPKDDPVLSRTYGPADLAQHLIQAGITGTVLVQAAPTVAETDYMLDLAAETSFVKGVVGWIDFENRADLRQLERLRRNPLFKGVRPMIQDIADPNWMLRPGLAWAFEALIDQDLTFDALGYPQHIDPFLRLFARYPALRVVLDHCLKPRIRDGNPQHLTDWSAGMGRLATETQSVLKFSALVTEDHADWSLDRLRPYAEPVLRAFGPDRIMWGSDWPVARLRCSYGTWLSAAQALVADLSDTDQEKIFGGTATAFYHLASGS